MIIPEKLKKGDKIGVIAPSSPITEKSLEAINNSILLMESSGFEVEFGKYVFKNTLGYGATAKEKADDINTMFANKEIKAIFCASGGANSNSTFAYLDYELIKNNPKILCGFSDATSLTNMITEKTGLVTFNGATFKSLTSWETPYGYEQVMKRFVEGSLSLAEPEEEFTTIQEGIAEGRLIGGNLSLISGMSSGKYSLDFTNKILFIEELYLESDAEMVSQYLYRMKQNEVFDKIKGIWVGNYEGNSALEKILLDTLEKEYNFPIIKSNNFGHTEKKQVIPIGTKAKIDTNNEIKIELLEPCVRSPHVVHFNKI